MPDSGIDLSMTYGALAFGCVLCTVFWSFLLVQTCANSPTSKGGTYTPSDAECTTMSSLCPFPHCAFVF
jgi:hypothetical protein